MWAQDHWCYNYVSEKQTHKKMPEKHTVILIIHPVKDAVLCVYIMQKINEHTQIYKQKDVPKYWELGPSVSSSDTRGLWFADEARVEGGGVGKFDNGL